MGEQPLAAEVAALESELTTLLRRSWSFTEQRARSVHPELLASAYGLLAAVVDGEVGPNGRVRATDLAEHFGIDKGTVSRQVRLLEQLGLLERVPDPSDARVLRLQATGVGRSALEAARLARRHRILDRITTWDPADVAALADLLGRFNDGHPSALSSSSD